MRSKSGATRYFNRFIFFGLYFLLFAAVAIPFWFTMREVVPRSISLVNESSWFSPVIADGTAIDYVGFLVPLIVSLIFLVVYACMKIKPPLPRSLKILAIVIPISFVLSQVTILGAFAALGLTDPISLTAMVIAACNLPLGRPTEQAVLLSYPLGFGVGLLSDLESSSYFHGIFGGYGFGDGDFVFPLGFLGASILFSLVWPRLFDLLLRAELWADKRMELQRKRGK